MTERKFRCSPSPGNSGNNNSNTRQRSLSAGCAPRSSCVNMDYPPPPVPAIPGVNQAAARARSSTKPKTLAFVRTPVRTASQKMAAAPQDKEAHGSWFGSATLGDARNVRTSDAVMASPKTRTEVHSPPLQSGRSSQDTLDRPESRASSINFSYPARARVASPSSHRSPTVEEERTIAPVEQPQPKSKKRSSTMSQRRGSVRSSRTSSILSDQTLVYDPNSRRMVSRSELTVVEPEALATSEKKAKNKITRPNRAGSHLTMGTMSRPRGTAVDNLVPTEAQMAAAASLRSRRNEPRQEIFQHLGDGAHEQPAAEMAHEAAQSVPAPQTQSLMISVSSPASNAPVVLGSPMRANPDGGLQRKYSVVREEDDESECHFEYDTTAAAAKNAVPVSHSAYAHGVPSPPQSENTDDQSVGSTLPRPAQPAAPLLAPGLATRQPAAETRRTEAVRRVSRAQSNSPGRSARFAPVEKTLSVKHEPPARSLSPRKSALKQSSPSREMSPFGETSDTSGVTLLQEPLMQRKKSVRVSFDDEKTVVVGEAAGWSDPNSPMPPSPQQATGRRPWYHTLGIGRKKDAVSLEENEVMQPRPALPSFGSVRGQRQSPQSAGERPLVRPPEALGKCGDDMLGTVINDRNVRNNANISNTREPLPPIVTSVEGGGDLSDTASTDDDAALLIDSPKLEAEAPRTDVQVPTLVPETSIAPKGSVEVTDERESVNVIDIGGATKQDAIPAISIIKPSPKPEPKQEERLPHAYFPGSFPETETETDNETLPARKATFEPVIQIADAQSTRHTPAGSLATPRAESDSTDTSDDSSIYSDAYEDLSDMDGDGFQSLNAVLETSAVSNPPVNILRRTWEIRGAVVDPAPQSYGEVDFPTPKAHNASVDPWAAAKAYWRSLSAEKRAQLEKDAADEAGVDADLEEMPSALKKPRRKKSTERRHAEKKAIEEERKTSNPSRPHALKPGTKIKNDVYMVSTGTSANRSAANPQQPANDQTESTAHLRRTMRAAEAQPVRADTHLRKTLRSIDLERPTSQASMSVTTTTSHAGKARAASKSTIQSTRSVLPPSLRRHGSDSSASSFKRARPANTGFGFRKTMRTSIGPLERTGLGREKSSSRFSMRSTSTLESMGSRSLRATLRNDMVHSNNSAFTSSTWRQAEASGKGYLRFPGSFAHPVDKKGKQRFSRFGDDSSDDDGTLMASRRGFRSRFGDSSDEEEAPRAAQGISKTMHGKGLPSPLLPKEEELSDIEEHVARGETTPGFIFDASAGTSPRRKRSGNGKGGGRRVGGGGFMSSVLRRNKKHDGDSKTSRSDIMETATKQDFTLEGPGEEPAALRSNSTSESHSRGRGGGGAQGSHKRTASPPDIAASDEDANWPLGDDSVDSKADSKLVIETNGEDGEASSLHSPSVLGHSRSQPTMRPTSMGRRTLSSTPGNENSAGEDLALDEDDVVPALRKKKFGALRRMFRLDE